LDCLCVKQHHQQSRAAAPDKKTANCLFVALSQSKGPDFPRLWLACPESLTPDPSRASAYGRPTSNSLWRTGLVCRNARPRRLGTAASHWPAPGPARPKGGTLDLDVRLRTTVDCLTFKPTSPNLISGLNRFVPIRSLAPFGMLAGFNKRPFWRSTQVFLPRQPLSSSLRSDPPCRRRRNRGGLARRRSQQTPGLKAACLRETLSSKRPYTD